MPDLESKEQPVERKYGLPKYRTEILEKLNDAFSNGFLEMDDYENRMELAHKANSIEELQKVIYDFPGSNMQHKEWQASSPEVKKPFNINIDMEDTTFTVLGENLINGVDLPSDNLNIVNILGETKIDLTSENYTKNIFEVNVFSLLGSIRIYAPDNVKVKSQAVSILGSTNNESPVTDSRQEKILIIKGVCILGEIKVIRNKKPGGANKRDIWIDKPNRGRMRNRWRD